MSDIKQEIADKLRSTVNSAHYQGEYASECVDAIEALIEERLAAKLEEAYQRGRNDALAEVAERGL